MNTIPTLLRACAFFTLITSPHLNLRAEQFLGSISGGIADIQTTRQSFSARIVWKEHTYRVTGAFNAQGSWVGKLGQPSSSDLTLTLSRSLSGIEGSLTDAGVATPFLCGITGEPSPYVGRFNTGTTRVWGQNPLVSSFFSLEISKRGQVMIRGRMHDGSAFTAGTRLARSADDYVCPIYTFIAKRQDVVLWGNIEVYFSDTYPTDRHTLGGYLGWFQRTKAKAAPGSSASGVVYAQGYSYKIMPEWPWVILPEPEYPHYAQALLFIWSADSSSAPHSGLQVAAKISVNNEITVDGPNPYQITIQVTPATGRYTGSFLHPTTGERLTFEGLGLGNSIGNGIYQNKHGVLGNFLIMGDD